ncbi:hypothetical protein GGR53DRAFT_403198 [Hypoxylon sp. FL1150]|nr:hypothetical protein GGR53DRAFT_403198 [Hypoxylon sp. FL1150]
MGPETLTMLSLSALACASAIATQPLGLDTRQVANCYWSGTAPFCQGECDSGYSDCGTDGCGDGACCATGYKKFCCLGGCSAASSALAIGLEDGSASATDAVPKPKIGGGDNNGTSDHKE